MFASEGAKSLVATYLGDTSYNGGSSFPAPHQVNAAAGPTPPSGGSPPVPTPLPPWMLALLLVTVVYRARKQSL